MYELACTQVLTHWRSSLGMLVLNSIGIGMKNWRPNFSHFKTYLKNQPGWFHAETYMRACTWAVICQYSCCYNQYQTSSYDDR